jgi:hypothetical protein
MVTVAEAAVAYYAKKDPRVSTKSDRDKFRSSLAWQGQIRGACCECEEEWRHSPV